MFLDVETNKTVPTALDGRSQAAPDSPRDGRFRISSSSVYLHYKRRLLMAYAIYIGRPAPLKIKIYIG